MLWFHHLSHWSVSGEPELPNGIPKCFRILNRLGRKIALSGDKKHPDLLSLKGAPGSLEDVFLFGNCWTMDETMEVAGRYLLPTKISRAVLGSLAGSWSMIVFDCYQGSKAHQRQEVFHNQKLEQKWGNVFVSCFFFKYGSWSKPFKTPTPW